MLNGPANIGRNEAKLKLPPRANPELKNRRSKYSRRTTNELKNPSLEDNNSYLNGRDSQDEVKIEYLDVKVESKPGGDFDGR